VQLDLEPHRKLLAAPHDETSGQRRSGNADCNPKDFFLFEGIDVVDWSRPRP
jgi:hypothetical protein